MHVAPLNCDVWHAGYEGRGPTCTRVTPCCAVSPDRAETPSGPLAHTPVKGAPRQLDPHPCQLSAHSPCPIQHRTLGSTWGLVSHQKDGQMVSSGGRISAGLRQDTGA